MTRILGLYLKDIGTGNYFYFVRELCVTVDFTGTTPMIKHSSDYLMPG